MRHFLVVALLVLAPLGATGSDEGWLQRATGLPAGIAWSSISIFDPNTVWIVGGNGPTTVWRTTDFGQSWLDANVADNPDGIPAFEYGSMAALGPQDAIVASESGKLYRTSDGGAHWTVTFSDPAVTGFFNDVEMLDAVSGFAMGDAPGALEGPALLKTTDAGWTWAPIQNDLPEGMFQYPNNTDFVSEQEGWTFSQSSGKGLYRTIDGGTSWTRQPACGNVASVCFLSEQIGFFTCSWPTDSMGVYRTTDGGATWQPSLLALAYGFVEGLSDGLHVWAGEDNNRGHNVYHSSDGGVTWAKQPLEALDPEAVLWDADFLSPHIGGIVGVRTVLLTKTGGVISGITTNEVPKITALSPNYPNPFNPSTTIRYALSHNSHVVLSVYSAVGEVVAILVEGEEEAGYHEVTFNASGLSGGVYFCRLRTEGSLQTTKMVLLR